MTVMTPVTAVTNCVWLCHYVWVVVLWHHWLIWIMNNNRTKITLKHTVTKPANSGCQHLISKWSPKVSQKCRPSPSSPSVFWSRSNRRLRTIFFSCSFEMVQTCLSLSSCKLHFVCFRHGIVLTYCTPKSSGFSSFSHSYGYFMLFRGMPHFQTHPNIALHVCMYMCISMYNIYI